MNTSDFRQSREDCAELERMINSRVFKKVVEAIFTDLDLAEATTLQANPDASDRLEMRLLQCRKGYTEFRESLRMCATPIQSAATEQEPEYLPDPLPEVVSGWQPAFEL